MIYHSEKNILKIFIELIADISLAKDDDRKIQLLKKYFQSLENESNKDAAFNLLIGNYPKRVINSKQIRNWTNELTGYPDWLIDRSEKETGNFIKAFALLQRTNSEKLADQPIQLWLSKISQLSKFSEFEIKEFIKRDLTSVEVLQRQFILKLVTGGFKSPMSKKQLIKALAEVINIEHSLISLRIYECNKTGSVRFNDLNQPINNENLKIPAPFPVMDSIDNSLENLAEYKKYEIYGYRNGIDAQVIKHAGNIFMWTSDLEIINEKFPEICKPLREVHSDFMILGQILTNNPDTPIDLLKNRIRKKTISRKDLEVATPIFSITEILIFGANRTINFSEIFRDYFSKISHIEIRKSIEYSNWGDLTAAHKKCRILGFSGFILKLKNSTENTLYWKADSYAINAILIYVELETMGNSGIRHMTFGLKQNDVLIPVARVKPTFDKDQIDELLLYTRQNTIEKFGPVRTVKPSLIYKLHFDSIIVSRRRKSGLALSNVTIQRKVGNDPNFADSIHSLKALV